MPLDWEINLLHDLTLWTWCLCVSETSLVHQPIYSLSNCLKLTMVHYHQQSGYWLTIRSKGVWQHDIINRRFGMASLCSCTSQVHSYVQSWLSLGRLCLNFYIFFSLFSSFSLILLSLYLFFWSVKFQFHSYWKGLISQAVTVHPCIILSSQAIAHI